MAFSVRMAVCLSVCLSYVGLPSFLPLCPFCSSNFAAVVASWDEGREGRRNDTTRPLLPSLPPSPSHSLVLSHPLPPSRSCVYSSQSFSYSQPEN